MAAEATRQNGGNLQTVKFNDGRRRRKVATGKKTPVHTRPYTHRVSHDDLTALILQPCIPVHRYERFNVKSL